MKCSYDGCFNDFEPRTHNMKYCSDECCRTATNEKLKEKYREKKERLAGKKRICKADGCSVILSRYNESNKCDRCENAQKRKDREAIIEMLKDVTGKTSKK